MEEKSKRLCYIIARRQPIHVSAVRKLKVPHTWFMNRDGSIPVRSGNSHERETASPVDYGNSRGSCELTSQSLEERKDRASLECFAALVSSFLSRIQAREITLHRSRGKKVRGKSLQLRAKNRPRVLSVALRIREKLQDVTPLIFKRDSVLLLRAIIKYHPIEPRVHARSLKNRSVRPRAAGLHSNCARDNCGSVVSVTVANETL